MKKIILLIFGAVCLGQLTGELFSISILASLGKFLLIPALGVVYWTYLDASVPATFNRRIMFALLFSYFGDIFLLFAQRAEILFIIGLVSFLVAHLAYISAFTFVNQIKKQRLSKFKYAVALIISFYCILMLALYPHLESTMKVAVPIYGLVICTMLFSVVNTKTVVPSNAFRYLLMGGILFLLSDTILALIKFHPYFLPAPFHDFLIMSTYIMGQFGLIWGSILMPTKR